MSYEGERVGSGMEPYSTEPVTLIEEVFPQDTNAYNTLFGGRLPVSYTHLTLPTNDQV